VPLLGCGGPRIVHYHEGLDTGQRDSRKLGGSKRPSYQRGTVNSRAERFPHTADMCHQLPLPFHACTGRASGGKGEFSTASCSKATPKLILSQADGRWKLCYSTSADEDWTVVDLGSLHNEGELLIAADDRLAELLE
jgi:hypothetical protein